MLKSISKFMIVSIMAAFVSTSYAHKSGLNDPKGALMEETFGLVTILRAQPQGMEYGVKKDRLDAEVIFKLDSAPDKVFGIRLHEGVDPSIEFIIGMLKEAFYSKTPINVLHNKIKGQKNISVIWVEVESKKIK